MLLFHHPDDLIDVLPADRVRRRLDHHADQRLRPALAKQNPSRIAQKVRHAPHLGLHIAVLLRRILILYPHIFQHLRIDRNLRGQLCQPLFFLQHDLHDL